MHALSLSCAISMSARTGHETQTEVAFWRFRTGEYHGERFDGGISAICRGSPCAQQHVLIGLSEPKPL